MTEYTGWDNYVNHKRTNQYLKQIKEEWKSAVNDYFGITIPTEDKPTAAHMKQIEFQISKLRNDIHTIHTRINQITDCGHGKLRKQLTPLVEGNVLGRIEALEQWRERIKDLEEKSIVKESTIGTFQPSLVSLYNSIVHGWYNLETKKIIDKQVWEDIKRFTGNVSYLRYTKDFEAQLGYLIKTIQKVDPEWEPSK